MALPPDPLEALLADIQVGEDDFRHNWLYSVVPVTSNEAGDLSAYLSGYCKVCQRAFTVKLPADSADSFVVVTQLDIPRWGCIDPQKALGI